MPAVIRFRSGRRSAPALFAPVEGETFPAHIAALVASTGERQADAMQRLREIVQKLERTIHCIRYLIADVAEGDVRDALVVDADIVDGLITMAREKLEQPAKLRTSKTTD